MPSSNATNKPKSLTYRFSRWFFTRKIQIIYMFASILAFPILLGLIYVCLTSYFGSLDQKEHQEYNIKSAMKSGLMIDCDYVVTPWYTNLCQNEDSGNAYTWRQYKLFKTDNPNCVDVYERTPCYDKAMVGLPNRTRIWPNSCPFVSMSAEEPHKYSWMPYLTSINVVAMDVKTPLISDLKPYLKQTVRGMDLFMLCPGCVFRGCGGKYGGMPLYNNYRHGWPYNFASCYFNKTILCG